MMQDSKHRGGWSTLELMVAFGILTVTFSNALLLVSQSRAISFESRISREAVRNAQEDLERIRATARESFPSVQSYEALIDNGFTKRVSLRDISPCLKHVTLSLTSSINNFAKTQAIFETAFISQDASRLLGHDCETGIDIKEWSAPYLESALTLSTGDITAFDVLRDHTYVAGSHAPYFFIAHIKDALNPDWISFTNGFTALAPINALDAFQKEGRTLVFLARETNEGQLWILDATEPSLPFLLATSSLSGVFGGEPGAFRIRAFQNSLYVFTRYHIAYPELHIFDITDPAHPSEFPAIDINTTVTDIAIVEQEIGGVKKIIGYSAVKADNRELLIYDFTNPLNPYEVRRFDLPGAQDGASLYALGTQLYFGRNFVADGPELYVFDISNPFYDLPIIAEKEISGTVFGITASGDHLFLITTAPGKRFQIWPREIEKFRNAGNPQGTVSTPGLIEQGIDYAHGRIFLSTRSQGYLQIFASRE